MVKHSFDGKLIPIVVDGIDEVAIYPVTAGSLDGEPLLLCHDSKVGLGATGFASATYAGSETYIALAEPVVPKTKV